MNEAGERTSDLLVRTRGSLIRAVAQRDSLDNSSSHRISDLRNPQSAFPLSVFQFSAFSFNFSTFLPQVSLFLARLNLFAL